jgi:hypothetical protein
MKQAILIALVLGCEGEGDELASRSLGLGTGRHVGYVSNAQSGPCNGMDFATAVVGSAIHHPCRASCADCPDAAERALLRAKRDLECYHECRALGRDCTDGQVCTLKEGSEGTFGQTCEAASNSCVRSETPAYCSTILYASRCKCGCRPIADVADQFRRLQDAFVNAELEFQPPVVVPDPPPSAPPPAPAPPAGPAAPACSTQGTGLYEVCSELGTRCTGTLGAGVCCTIIKRLPGRPTVASSCVCWPGTRCPE